MKAGKKIREYDLFLIWSKGMVMSKRLEARRKSLPHIVLWIAKALEVSLKGMYIGQEVGTRHAHR